DHHASASPERVAYRVGDVAVTYRQMVDGSIRIANLLRSRGLRRGDTVAIVLPNVPGLFEVVWACQRSGLLYTLISTRLNASDTAYILQDSDASVVVVSAATADATREALEITPVGLRFAIGSPVAGFETIDELLPSQPAEPSADECEGSDLLYSSGTTGRPKAISVEPDFAPLGTNQGSGPFLQQTWGFDADTVYLSPAPLYHAAPLRFCLVVHRFGGTVIVMDRFDAERALDAVQRHRVTHTQMVPTMLVRILRLPEDVRLSYDMSSLRAVVHAAAPCPPPVKRAMIEWLGPIVDEYYSSTENALMTLIRSDEALSRPGSVGRAIIGTPHILDDDGHEVPTGVSGNIWSEGGLDFVYRNDPEKTAAARNERGWTTVGDLGHLDDEGYLFLSDRRADLILSGGVNIYPQESENVLIGHQAVSDVAVIGVPDDELGEKAQAFVQLRPGHVASDELAQELLDFCAAGLSRFKCPRALVFVEDFPRTPTGKLMRRELRVQFTTKELT
ncbi:MAG: AMP-binding protein, partial [Aeromicrobium sp.]